MARNPIFSATFLRKYKVPGLRKVYHISSDRTGKVWASDDQGILVRTDQNEGRLSRISTNKDFEANGIHTVTKDGDLIYIGGDKKINMVSEDGTTTKLIDTGKWTPESIHSSHINGDILVGMTYQDYAKVNRYTMTGRKKQILVLDKDGYDMFDLPHYITENIRGDICISDWRYHAVVVVKKSGEYGLSYKIQDESRQLQPYGICTYDENHFLVCDRHSETVHFVKHDYTRTIKSETYPILTSEQEVNEPRALCLDYENNLHVGQSNTNIVKVFKIQGHN